MRYENPSPPPEKPIVKTLCLKPEKYGYHEPDGDYNDIYIEEVVFPIYDRNNLIIGRAYTYDLEKSSPAISPSDARPHIALVYTGGGSSTADESLYILPKIRHAVSQYEKTENQIFPYRVHVVVLPHLGTTTRKTDAVDPAQENSFKPAAQFLAQALNVPELGVTHIENIGLIGFSAGGAVVQELTPMLGARCKFTVLCDAAGITDHPNISYEFSIGQIIAGFNKYHKKDGLSITKSLKQSFEDFLTVNSTRFGNITGFPKFIKEMLSPTHATLNKTNASVWGIENDLAKDILPIHLLDSDSTQKARESIKSPIIFAPFLYASVVNTLFQKLKEQQNLKHPQNLGVLPDLEGDVHNLLCQLFPSVNPEDLKFVRYESVVHSAISEQRYWNQIVSTIGNSYPPTSNSLN